MKKILIYIAKGTFNSLMVVTGYIVSTAAFIEIFSSTGYMAVLMFVLAILVLAIVVFISWFIGYAYDNAPPLRKKEGDANDVSGQFDD